MDGHSGRKSDPSVAVLTPAAKGLPAAPHSQLPLKGLFQRFLTPAQPQKGLAGLL